MQINHNHTHIHSLLSLPHFPTCHPSRSSQSTRLGSPCYTPTSHQWSTLHRIVHICWMLLSAFIPHSPSPTVPINPSSLSTSPFLPCKQVHQCHFSRFHIYALIYISFFFLTYFTLYNRLKVHQPHLELTQTRSFYDSVISHCIYEAHLLHSFICQWTSRWLPCLGYCQKYCNEHSGECIF